MLFEGKIGTVSTNFSERQKFTTLSKNDIHIWQISLVYNKDQLDLCKSVLDKETVKKAEWFKFEEDQNKYILCQGILRLLLADYLNLETSEISISRQKKGKPFVANQNPVFFNMSDSGNICVYAFTLVGELGIDIEKKRNLPDIDELIQKNLTMREIEYIRKKPSEKLNIFFRLWTIKEAYLKAIGEGMRLTPDKLEFSVDSKSIKHNDELGIYDHEDWIIKEFIPKTSYFGTLVYKNRNVSITRFVL